MPLTPRTRADFEARDRLYRENFAAFNAWRKATQPCKGHGSAVRADGGCLRCDADAGEICREPDATSAASLARRWGLHKRQHIRS